MVGCGLQVSPSCGACTYTIRRAVERVCRCGHYRCAVCHHVRVPTLPERVQADGLVIRRWVPEDAELQHDLITRNVEHLRPRMAWIRDEPLGVEDRRALIVAWEAEWRAGGDAYYVITSSVDGSGLGSCGLHRRIGPNGLEVGYWVDSRHLRQGIATRTARALTDLAFSIDGIDLVEIPHDRENLASRGVPAGLGFDLVGDRPARTELAPADTGTDTLWRISKQHWVARRERPT